MSFYVSLHFITIFCKLFTIRRIIGIHYFRQLEISKSIKSTTKGEAKHAHQLRHTDPKYHTQSCTVINAVKRENVYKYLPYVIQ